ncbi:TonB-dependent receptor [Roseateles oligotrophus]|uniref:TonB-dependent receptor n=1 Tax=Roseateles oligotrophus TaxID=1769250 RepID=A0ABT2YKR0_9BURK|nr:TonB-dependent receptor [Roseateles oligotrophus]MCV2370646.1 TonB-dependent receptor [Roseateles oligotrophus]
MLKTTRLSTALALIYAGGLAITAPVAMGQETLERVAITGSSIKRIDAETSVPVTVITRASIDRSGASNVQELVDRLSSNNGGGRSLGESIGDSNATGQTGASMRGLGRERTLVLLNGRRLTPYPFAGQGVDLNAIPLAAIERIEVLRDGASATYGSDAIGGVINFITRKDFTGGEFTVSIESPQAKGGQVKGITGGAGFGDLAKDKFNILGTFSYEKYDVIKASDRDFSKTGNRPDIGVVKSSGNTFPANAYLNDTYISPVDGKDKAGSFVPGVPGFPTCAPPDSFKGGSNCRYDYSSKIDIVPASERMGALARATVQLNSDTVLFGEFAYSKNEITFGSSQTPSSTTGRPDYLYPAGGKFYPTAKVDASFPGYRGDLVIAWRMVDGGQRLTKTTNDMTRVLVGAEGTFAGFDYKAGLMKAKATAVESFLTGNFSDTKLVQVLKTGNVNPFGANDAAGLALLKTAELSGENRNSHTDTDGFDFSVTRELFAMGGGNAAIAVGLDLRKEKYLDGYSDIAGSGDIVGGSGNAGKVKGERNTRGLFAELNLPVIKDVELNLAMRSDKYSNSKGESRDGSSTTPDMSSTSPKVGIRWTPMKTLLLRASAGKGFRAPALDNLYAPSAGTNLAGNFNDPYYNTLVGCANKPDPNYCDTQLTAINNSNSKLKPEKSKTTSLGMVFEPIKDLSTEVDYFDIQITDGITTLSGDDIMKDWYKNQTGPTTSTSVYANRLVKNAKGYLDYVNASLENIGKQRASGFDFSAKYRIRSEMGTFTPGWEATLLTKSTTTNVVTGVEIDNLGKYARGGPAVKFKQTMSLDWDSGAWAAGVRYFRQSSYEDYDEVHKVPAYDLWDLQGQYKGIKNLAITAGIRNLLDKKPPSTVQEDYFQVGFDPTYADVKGRTYYLRANYKF